MELIKFNTKYGEMVVGGRFGNIIRTPSNQEELVCPVTEAGQELIDRAEREHEESLEKHLRDWNLT